jgi:hypothetical protein
MSITGVERSPVVVPAGLLVVARLLTNLSLESNSTSLCQGWVALPSRSERNARYALLSDMAGTSGSAACLQLPPGVGFCNRQNRVQSVDPHDAVNELELWLGR